jgi:hypothetical protein
MADTASDLFVDRLMAWGVDSVPEAGEPANPDGVLDRVREKLGGGRAEGGDGADRAGQ